MSGNISRGSYLYSRMHENLVQDLLQVVTFKSDRLLKLYIIRATNDAVKIYIIITVTSVQFRSSC